MSAAFAQSAENRYEFHIEGGALGPVMEQIHEATGIQLLFSYDLVDFDGVNAVNGQYTVQEAMTILLHDTGLTSGLTESGMIVITRENSANAQNREDEMASGKVKKGLLASVSALIFGMGSQGSVLAQDSENDAISEGDVIVVTANRRGNGSSIQDTPISVTAISAQDIQRRGLVELDDFLRTTPGVNFQDRGSSQNSIVIRGIASDPQREREAVGVYFGETPITGLGSSGGLAGNADMKLVDIERIEVLRGPQGTLFGAGSMGGTVRILPASPDLQNYEGGLMAGYSHTGELGGDNTNLQGVVNIPVIEDKLAVRAVGYWYDNSGYIDNVAGSAPTAGVTASTASGGAAENEGDIGSEEYVGFRVSALWRPTPEFELNLSHSYQEIEQNGIPEIDTTLSGAFEQSRLNTGPLGSRSEFSDNSINLTNLVASYNFGWGTVINSNSWISYDTQSDLDLANTFFAPMYFEGSAETSVFVEEFRFVSSFDGPFQILAGIYYEEKEFEAEFPILWSGDPAFEAATAGAFSGGAFTSVTTIQDSLNKTDQLAFFGELSYDVTDQITATFGVRHFEYDQVNLFDGSGLFLGGVIDNRVLRNSENGQTYKANITYEPSDDVLLYAQWAEGFRLGEPRSEEVLGICDLDMDGLIDGLGVAPTSLNSDELESFEIGFKTSIADDRVTINGALYHINWDGIPVTIIPPCGIRTPLNAGESKSQGVELEARILLTDNLIWDLGGSYVEAQLTEDIPFVTGFGADGDDLLGSPDFNFNTALEYRFSIAGMDAFARGDYAYVGEYFHNFNETGPASGDYHQVNLKAGARIENVSIEVFVTNLTDADEFTWVETVFGGTGTGAYRLRPRTIGVNVGLDF